MQKSMIQILHGDNILASRKALQAIKKIAGNKEILVLDGKKVDLTDLKQALEARSLFGSEKLVVVEGLIATRKPVSPSVSDRPSRDGSQGGQGNKATKTIFDYLKSLPIDVDLVLWEGKKIDGRFLSRFKNAKIQLFKTPVVIFKFLESIRPYNIKIMLNLLNACSTTEPIELIFYMIVRQFRQLLLVKSLGKKGVTRLAPWQYFRLTNQASYFTMEKLLKIYKELLRIDLEQKTGQAALDLKKTIEFLLVTKF